MICCSARSPAVHRPSHRRPVRRLGALAGMTDGGWKFVAPIEGAQVIDGASGQPIVLRGGAWESGVVRAQESRVNGQTVVRQRRAAIADPTGGTTTTDAECRAAVTSIL